MSRYRLLGCAWTSVLMLFCSPQTSSASDGLSTEMDRVGLRRLSTAYPCAMLAALYIMSEPHARAGGERYVEWIPSGANVAPMVDQIGIGNLAAVVIATHLNPYAAAPTVVRISWRPNHPGSNAIAFRAEVIKRSGELLPPGQVLEAVTLELSGRSVRVVQQYTYDMPKARKR